MSKLEHTRIVRLENASFDLQDEQFDAICETIIGMEDTHPKLLDSAVFADKGKRTLGITITTAYSESYADAVAHAEHLIINALDIAGIVYSDEEVINEDGPRSLALS